MPQGKARSDQGKHSTVRDQDGDQLLMFYYSREVKGKMVGDHSVGFDAVPSPAQTPVFRRLTKATARHGSTAGGIMMSSNNQWRRFSRMSGSRTPEELPAEAKKCPGPLSPGASKGNLQRPVRTRRPNQNRESHPAAWMFEACLPSGLCDLE